MNGVIVVTGAARGIGRVIAEKMASTGPLTVIGVDLAPELALAEQITAVQVDLTSPEGPATVRKAVEDSGLPLLGLVNNAGITRDSRLINMTDEDFRSVLEVNLGAAYRLCVELAPLMSDGASIVNIASRAYLGNFGQFNYSMSKGGVVGLTRALALSLAPANQSECRGAGADLLGDEHGDPRGRERQDGGGDPPAENGNAGRGGQSGVVPAHPALLIHHGRGDRGRGRTKSVVGAPLARPKVGRPPASQGDNLTARRKLRPTGVCLPEATPARCLGAAAAEGGPRAKSAGINQ